MSATFKNFLAALAEADDGQVAALHHYLDKIRVEKATPMDDEELVIKGWGDLQNRLTTFTEEDLRAIINYEVSTYRRKTILERLHMRYCKLRDANERAQLLSGEVVL